MNRELLARNIRRLRNARSLSQNRLAEAAGLSLPTVKNLEGAKCAPRMRTLQVLARALRAPLRELFEPVPQLKTVRFRSARSMRIRENVLAEVARRLRDFAWLEEALEEGSPFALAEARNRCSREKPERAAALCREALNRRSNEPIYDLCGQLEEAGVKVLPLRYAAQGFFGLSVGEEDGGPAVAVNVHERISVERRIFSAAHELGHLVLHPAAFQVERADENAREEREADAFAAHFLLPPVGFRREWNDAAGLPLFDRVLKVKRIFRVSYKTVLRRLIEEGAPKDPLYGAFDAAFEKRFGRRPALEDEPLALGQFDEPDSLPGSDFVEDRFQLLVRRAVEREIVSLSRAAEMLGVPIEDMRTRSAEWESVA